MSLAEQIKNATAEINRYIEEGDRKEGKQKQADKMMKLSQKMRDEKSIFSNSETFTNIDITCLQRMLCNTHTQYTYTTFYKNLQYRHVRFISARQSSDL